MYEYRPYIIAIAAVFLALASGILIGITFGEDVVVSNQKEMIEFMEHRLTDLQKSLAGKERELERWQDLAPLVFKGFAGSLAGNNILLLAVDDPLALELLSLSRNGGAETLLVELPGRAPPAGLRLDRESALLFAGKLTGAGEEENLEEGGCRTRGEISGEPDFIILCLKPDPALPGELFLKLLAEELLLAGYRVFAAYAEEREEGTSFSPEARVIENLSTFWGKLNLLETLLEAQEKIPMPGEEEGVWSWK